jgi:hypothetical protein
MKKNILRPIIILLLATITTSCGVGMFHRINGDKNVVRKDRKLNNDFRAIKVSSGLALYITQGNKTSLSIEADENLHSIILTEVKNGELHIYTEKSIWRAKARKIHVTVKNLEELEVNSGSDAFTENILVTANFNINVSSGAHAKIAVNATNIAARASSGAKLKIMGATENHTVSASSGSTIYAYELKSKKATVKSSSGGNISVFASETLDAKASSGGDIVCRGNPKTITKKTSSGGRISAQ